MGVIHIFLEDGGRSVGDLWRLQNNYSIYFSCGFLAECFFKLCFYTILLKNHELLN